MTCTCGTPTSGAHLCDKCSAQTLAVSLMSVADFTDDLDNVRAKQTRYGQASKGSIGKAIPAPMDLRFSGSTEAGTALADEARATVVAWARVLMDERSEIDGPLCRACIHRSCAEMRLRRWPADTVRSMCLYLDRNYRYIAGRDWAPDLLDEMLDLERRLRRFVNPPAERQYAGKCDCGEELYATMGKPVVKCRECSAEYDVAERRDFLLAAARDYLVTATEAASALIAWTEYDGSVRKVKDLIHTWRERGRLMTRGETTVNGRTRHLYRLGDVQERLVEHAQREQSRQLARR